MDDEIVTALEKLLIKGRLLFHVILSIIIAGIVAFTLYVLADNYFYRNTYLFLVIAATFTIMFTVVLCTYRIVHEIKKIKYNARDNES